MSSGLVDLDESQVAIKPDGSLTQMARDVLRACLTPATEEEVSKSLVRHFSQVGPLVRDCIHLDLLEDQDGRLALTVFGREKLAL
jgi:hypothetical protein